jgi:GTP-binding protein
MSASPSSTATSTKTKITKLFQLQRTQAHRHHRNGAGRYRRGCRSQGITIGETITSRESDAAAAHRDRRTHHCHAVHGQHLAVRRQSDGQYVTSRNLRERLEKELLTNVSLRVESTNAPILSKCWAAENCSFPS